MIAQSFDKLTEKYLICAGQLHLNFGEMIFAFLSRTRFDNRTSYTDAASVKAYSMTALG